MPYPVSISIWKRDIDNPNSKGKELEFASTLPEEGELHLSPDGKFVVLEMKDRTDVFERRNLSQKANVMNVTVSLSLGMCSMLVDFLGKKGLIKVSK